MTWCPNFDFPLLNFRTKTTEFAFNAWHIFYSEKDLRTNLFPSKNINKYGRWFEDQRCSCLTISVIVFNMASRHLLNMENKGYSGALGIFLWEEMTILQDILTLRTQ